MAEDVQELTSPDRVVRVAALDRLVDRAAKGDQAAVSTLRMVVTGYRRYDVEIYTRTLNRLWLFGDQSLEQPLLDALADSDYGCQAWTATALGRLGLRAAEPQLIALSKHPDPLTRESVCRALGKLSSTAAVASLLTDEMEFVRAAASDALADIGGDDALAYLWAAFESRQYVRLGYLAVAVARFGPAVFDRLVRAAADDDAEMRFWAARALGATGDQRAAPVLSRLAADDHATTRTGAHVSTAAKRAFKTLRRMQPATGF
ncbi:HEAT repeat domain-containing protein [Asanoa sp. NPDC049518]|uniref:HEAT repeat domain-containing protein n=1 Tax=unclassified Asanoa TaxID=2685164 RepID=UPI0034248F13